MKEFDEVWVIDFEFHQPPGERPEPLCLVAHELHSGRRISLRQDQFGPDPPFDIGERSLVVAYFASAEMGCFLQLGWPSPENLLDLYVEFRNCTNGRPTPAGSGLLGALAYYGLEGGASATKDEMRELAIRGGPFSEEERRDLLHYCGTDVDATVRLVRRMWDEIEFPYALLRGHYMVAAAHMERTGIPIDVARLALLREHWDSIKDDLIHDIDDAYGVFEGHTFKLALFERWLMEREIPWPRTATGRLSKSDETFEVMARIHPEVQPLRELLASLGTMRKFSLPVGSDGRNRCLISPFSSKGGRNQPSTTKFAFGLSAWLRGLIKPEPGMGIAYIDYCQQEFGIAAALSGDPPMMRAYESGDPYMDLAIQAGAAPKGATKASHSIIRERFKVCSLGVQYGMTEYGLSREHGIPLAEGRELLRMHHRAFPQFWEWSQGWVDHAMLAGRVWTVFGWNLRTPIDPNSRTYLNFPMQANGAEMLRLGCCYATRAGIQVCAPVHDALLVEAPVGELPAAVEKTQALMREASRVVLGGFELESDASLVVYPNRYRDRRGDAMWNTVWSLIPVGEARGVTTEATKRYQIASPV